MSDAILFDKFFKPIVSVFGKRLISQFNLNSTEDDISQLFFQCMISPKDQHIAPKATNNPNICSWDGCTTRCMKPDNNINGVLYCSKHIQKARKTHESKAIPTVEVKDISKEETKWEQIDDSKSESTVKPTVQPKDQSKDKTSDTKCPINIREAVWQTLDTNRDTDFTVRTLKQKIIEDFGIPKDSLAGTKREIQDAVVAFFTREHYIKDGVKHYEKEYKKLGITPDLDEIQYRVIRQYEQLTKPKQTFIEYVSDEYKPKVHEWECPNCLCNVSNSCEVCPACDFKKK